MKRLGYYTPQFPFPQGASAGPYKPFVGRSRVACVFVGPSGPVATTARKRRGCGCRRHGLRFLGDGSQPFIVMDPETASIYDPNTGMINTPTAGPQVAAGVPDVTDLPLTPPSGDVSLSPLAPGAAPGPPESPSGSQLLYQVSWTSSLAHPLTGSSQAVAAFTQGLPAFGNMSVISSNVTSPPVLGGITGYSANFLISDDIGHQYLTDAQGVCDALMRSIVGNNLSGSSISLASGLPFNLTNFLERNWPVLALGTVGVLVLWKIA